MREGVSRNKNAGKVISIMISLFLLTILFTGFTGSTGPASFDTTDTSPPVDYENPAMKELYSEQIGDMVHQEKDAQTRAYSYRTYASTVTELQTIETNNPNICKLYNIGTSVEGRTIYAMKVSDNPATEEADEPDVLYTGLHHAREWPSVEVPMYFLNHLMNNYGSDVQITWLVDNREMWIVPIVNPDGLEYSQTVDDMWRKNRRDNGDGTFGVDPNRNYGYEWGVDDQSSSDPGDDTYIGPAPFSEPEVQAIRDLALTHDFTVALNYHTFSDLVLYPWGYTYDPAPDSAKLHEIATALAADSGYTPEQSSSLYTCRGSSGDWLYGDRDCFAFTVELGEWRGTYEESFHPSDELVVNGMKTDNLGANIFLAEIADNRNMNSPVIKHTPLVDSTDEEGPYNVTAVITSELGLGAGQPVIYWKTESTSYTEVGMQPAPDTYYAHIPGQTVGTRISYYISAADVLGNTTTHPKYAPYENHSFDIISFGNDAAAVSVDTFDDGAVYPMNTYSIDATVKNLGTDTQGPFDVSCEVQVQNPPVSSTLLFDDFEGADNNGWTLNPTLSNSWEKGAPFGAGNPGAYSGTSVWATNLNGDYNNNDFDWLISPTLNIPSDIISANLTFWQYYSIEDGYDFGRLAVSTDGSNYSTIYSYTGVQTSWHKVEHDLTQYAGESINIAFIIKADDFTTDIGWYIDDVNVSILQESWTTVFGPSVQSTSGYMLQYDTQSLSWVYDFNVEADYKIFITTLLSGDEYNVNNQTVERITVQGTPPSPQTFDITLDHGLGWYLVSFPFTRSDDYFEDVLDDLTYGVHYDEVMAYDGGDASDPWKAAVFNKPGHMNDLVSLDNKMGLWIHMIAFDEDSQITISGYAPAATNIPLYTGWNLVSYPSSASDSIGNEMSSLGVNYKVSGYSGSTPYNLQGLSDADLFEPGKGYWVWVDSDCVWTVSW